jgi:hypothetical protein
MLRSKTYAVDTTIAGVLLGEPVIVTSDGHPFQPGDDIADLWFGWDDSLLPAGELVDGEVIPDEIPVEP